MEKKRGGRGPIRSERSLQLFAGFVAMVMVSNYQYAFTLFQPGIQEEFSASLPLVAGIFSVFAFFGTWPMPFAGYLVDRIGARLLMTVGSLGILLGWLLGGYAATSVFELYLYYGAFAGTGVGMIYMCAAGNAVKWFPDRRGFAAGMIAMGFGGGAAFTVIPVSLSISTYGWRTAMVAWGLIQGSVALIASLKTRDPPPSWEQTESRRRDPTKVIDTGRDYPWHRTIRTVDFWLLYAIFVMMGVGGLMASASLSVTAKWLNVENATVFGMSIVPLTVTTSSIANGASRMVWGTVSDRLGRESAMGMAFLLNGLLTLAVLAIAGNAMLFVLLFPLIFLTWGEIFALFSAITADLFGSKNATTNYGMIYTAKGVSSILAGYGAALLTYYAAGSLAIPYLIAGILGIAAGILAITVLRRAVAERMSGVV